MTVTIVSSGQTQHNLTISGDATLEISNGGIADATSVGAGGAILVSAGGVANLTLISSGGIEKLFFNGFDSGAQIYDGGAQIISGGFALSAAIDGGASQAIHAQGFASQTMVNSGGQQFIYSGGESLETSIKLGGTETVFNKGFSFSTTLSDGVQNLRNAGSANDTAISQGGIQYVDSGGFASATLIYYGGTQSVLASGSAALSLISAGGQQIVAGFATSTTVDSSATQIIEASGRANTTYLSGGELIVSGGAAFDTTITSGSLEVIEDNALTSGIWLQIGGSIDLPGMAYTTSTKVIYTSATNDLSIDNAGGGRELQLSGNYAGQKFTLSADGSGGTLIKTQASILRISSGAIITSTAVGSASNDTTLTILSGAIAINPILTLSGTAMVASSGLTINSHLYSSSVEIVSAGATARGSIIEAFARQEIAGGTAFNTIISGGQETILSGGTVTAASVFAPGAQIVEQGATANLTTVFNAGYLDVTSGGLASGAIIESGGTINVASGAVAIGTIVQDGGTEIVASGAQTGAIALHAGGKIAFSQLAYSSSGTDSFNSATGILTVSSNDQTETVHLTGDFSGVQFTLGGAILSSGGFGFAVTAQPLPCFAAGTHILTTAGEVAVENLTTRHVVPTLLSRIARRVRWIGVRHTDIAHHPTPGSVQPIRVTKNAFGENHPDRDLRLSPHHAIFVKPAAGSPGFLVPIRHLLNGATIFREYVSEIMYYHVELEDESGAPVHDVIQAQGLAVESFLDTGNRGAFENGGSVVMLHPDFIRDRWKTMGCAKLVESGAEIVKLRSFLHQHIAAQGFALCRDPALVVIAAGQEITPLAFGSSYRFQLPPQTDSALLKSRGFVPAQIRPDCNDIETYGIAVNAITLDSTPVALTDARLRDGWHTITDGARHRWTTGEARLHLDGARLLSLRCAPLGLYWQKTPDQIFSAKTSIAPG